MAKVTDTVHDAHDGTRVDVPRAGMANNLTTHTILLCGEGECNECDAVEVSKSTCQGVDALVANEELHVTKPERVAFAGTAVLAGSKEPEECHVTKVGDG